MKAYFCICPACKFKGDRIVSGNDVLKCKCGTLLEKQGGPIGGSNILPLGPQEPDRFVAFKSETLNRMISSETEMKSAYEEMYGVKAVEVATSPTASVSDDDDDEEDDVPQKPRRGRPKKTTQGDEEDDEDKDDGA